MTSITGVKSQYGRADTIFNEVSSTIRMPVFVDNAVLHAEYKRQRDSVSGQRLQISPPTASDFQYVHDRTYSLVEQQDGVRINHPTKPGSNYTGGVYFNGYKLNAATAQEPLLLIGEEDISQRLAPSDPEVSTYGTELTIPNMKGRTLDELGFDNRRVRMGHTIGVGFRTTDAVQRLFTNAYHSLNSVDIGLRTTGPRSQYTTNYKGADIARHSTRFIAQDFYDTGIIKAMKYIGRYDGHMTYMDRFGNLLYAPNVFSFTDRKMGESTGIENVKMKPLMGESNRIIVEGRQIALNDSNVVTVDDLEAQKKHGSIKASNIFHPLARTSTQARRTAAQGLRMNRRAQEVMSSEGHINSWDLDPGDIIAYNAPSIGITRNTAIISATHSLRSHSSDFTLVGSESGIESLLTMTESVSELANGQPDHTNQIQMIETSNTGAVGLKVRPRIRQIFFPAITTRTYSGLASDGGTAKTIINTPPNRHAGFILGHRYSSDTMASVSRGAIGVGASLSTTISAYTHGTTTLTVGSTAGFPSSGYLMVVSEESTKSIMFTYTGIAGGTSFTGTYSGASGNISFSPHARVIFARPRAHEAGNYRSKEQVIM